jgi:hypothetical protein
MIGWVATSELRAIAPIRTPSPARSIAAIPSRPRSTTALGVITSSRIRSISVVPPARKLAPALPAAAIAARASAGRT